MIGKALHIDATKEDQHRIACHLHALTALKLAIARGDEWIRVSKPGHSCDFMVSALRQQVNRTPQTAPHCIINVPLAEQARLGTTVDSFTRRWPGMASPLVVTTET